VLIDDRSWQYFLGTYLPSQIGSRPATVYIGPVADSTGAPFVAGVTHKVTLPPDMPISQFWSLIVYDAGAFAFIYNPLGRAGLSSFDKDTLAYNYTALRRHRAVLRQESCLVLPDFELAEAAG
jgi:Protein of unknown function (DUF1214)